MSGPVGGGRRVGTGRTAPAAGRGRAGSGPAFPRSVPVRVSRRAPAASLPTRDSLKDSLR
ncbi:hypothetical protein Shyhy01_35130 [Streptomyces hygroscopicus subsp. hygroscopicus]|nr:hypothetical protein Shyhy01_35130 [Streptomyces hygroscopicus subsp. hygroscopicus]